MGFCSDGVQLVMLKKSSIEVAVCDKVLKFGKGVVMIEVVVVRTCLSDG